MRCRVDLLQHADGNVRVNLRRIEPRMPEHLLNKTDVGAAFEHQRGHRMAEQMARATLADARLFDVLSRRAARYFRASGLCFSVL